MDFMFFDRLDKLRCDSNSCNMITPIFCQCHYLVQSEKMFKQNQQTTSNGIISLYFENKHVNSWRNQIAIVTQQQPTRQKDIRPLLRAEMNAFSVKIAPWRKCMGETRFSANQDDCEITTTNSLLKLALLFFSDIESLLYQNDEIPIIIPIP